MGLMALLALQRKAYHGFLSPLKIFASAGFEPVNLGSSGMHTNHHTTDMTVLMIRSCGMAVTKLKNLLMKVILLLGLFR
jgi:hypothetical protein